MFIYYNVNPKGERIGDCVVRAISLALNIDYNIIEKELINISLLYNCDMLNKCCYNILLEDKYKLKRYKARSTKVKDLLQKFPDKTLIIRIDEHLTCAINGVVYDIWNPLEEYVDMFWIKE